MEEKQLCAHMTPAQTHSGAHRRGDAGVTAVISGTDAPRQGEIAPPETELRWRLLWRESKQFDGFPPSQPPG